MRISVLQWTGLGRRRHTDFIRNRLHSHESKEFGAEGIQLGFFIDVDRRDFPAGDDRACLRNAYYKDDFTAFCTFKVWKSEVFLPEQEFKQVLASRFNEASQHFSTYFAKKLPSFESEKYIAFIRSEMKVYLETEIEATLTSDEEKIVKFQTGI